MRRSLLVYALSGLGLLTLYGVGGFSGWWKSPSFSGLRGGTGGGGYGGGFRGGK
ncbi:MAG TPA: hypothetical protein VND21_05815 [Planctomycetota bacterium]|jgi:hypothetical protein|nr:hypothetical protein [Planctomycetota bacterium]